MRLDQRGGDEGLASQCRSWLTMAINIDEKKLKHGLLGLVLALIEIIRDALRLQAVRRVEGGSLTEEEVERLGKAFIELDKAIEQIKTEQGISEAVASVREGLDDLVDDALRNLVAPGVTEAVGRAAKEERKGRDERDLCGADAAVGR